MLKIKREELMIDVTKGSIIGRQSLMTRVGTLSIPGALLEGIALITGKEEYFEFKGEGCC